MYHDFLGPRGLQGTHMDTLKPKNSKLITFTVRGGFFTFWAILAHSMAGLESWKSSIGHQYKSIYFSFFQETKSKWLEWPIQSQQRQVVT